MLISTTLTKDNWTKAVIARTVMGERVMATNRRAASWCLVGHVRIQYPNVLQRMDIYKDLARTIRILYPDRYANLGLSMRMFSYKTCTAFNDGSFFEDVQHVVKVAGV